MAEKITTVGIVADNYKIPTFEKELKKEGFTDYTITKFTGESKLIKIKCPASEVGNVQAICQKCQKMTQRSN